MIDTHVHILDPARYPYPAATLGYRPTPSETGSCTELLAVMDAHGVECAVVVAASVYGADDRSLLDAARQVPTRLGLVLGADPKTPHAVAEAAPGVVGLRLNLTDDRRWSDQGRCRAVIEAARAARLTLCLHAPPRQAAALLDGHDGTCAVLDHLGRPDLDGGFGALREMAGRPDTWLKLSGGFRINPAKFPEPDANQYAAVAAFPKDQLIWGSDWPFIALAGPRPSYRDCLQWARCLTEADLAANARRLFWARP